MSENNETMQDEQNIELEEIMAVSTELFDIEGEGVRYPKRIRRGEKKTKPFKFSSIYLPMEEFNLAMANAEKHRMSLSFYLRTLILNAN